MKPGLTSYAYAWAIGIPGFPAPARPMDATRLVRRAAELDLRVVQLCDNLPLLNLNAAGRRALVKSAESEGVTLQLGGRGLTPENLTVHLQLATDLGARLLRFVIDGRGYEPALPDIASLLRNALPEIERRELTLAIENHDRFRAAELAGLMAEVGSNRVGICLDTANSLGAGEGLETVLRTLGPQTVNLHVKDVVVARFPHSLGFTIEGCAAGRGVVGRELPNVLAMLRATGRCDSCLLESWPAPGPTLEETLARENAWLEEGAVTLRHLLQPEIN